jgi:hypothetical protein
LTVDGRLAKAFGVSDADAWRRHANPWSVYNPFSGTGTPHRRDLVARLDRWWSLVAIGAVAMWTMINPRVFGPPQSMDTWASRSVLAERYWSARKESPIPERHRVAPFVLGVISAAGVPFWAWGLIGLDPWITAFGLAVQMFVKLWFLDRMALLYDDIHP